MSSAWCDIDGGKCSICALTRHSPASGFLFEIVSELLLAQNPGRILHWYVPTSASSILLGNGLE
jgi:hypothetical protein